MPLTYAQTQSLARYRERKKRSLNTYDPPEASVSITAQYMRDIRRLATQVTKLVIKHVLPVLEEYEDFYSDPGTQQDVDLGAALSNAFLAIEIALRDQAKQLDTYTREAATRAFTSGNKFHRRKWVKEINKLAGIDIRSILNEKPVEALLLDKIDENVNLIKTVQPQYLGQVKEAVTEGLQRGDDFFSIKNRLKEIQGTNEKYRPNLIARDQMNKLTGALDHIRQEDLGIDSYVWRTSQDQNVRTSHEANENEVFQWAAPPPTGHPGQDINCRCVAEPNFPKWFSKLEKQRGWTPKKLPPVPKSKRT